MVAIGLTVVVGAIVLVTLFLLFLGAQVGQWIAGRAGMEPALAAAWPYIRWLAVVGFTTLSVEILYFLAPNVRQRFQAQIAGASVAVLLWLVGSFVLKFYLRSFAEFTAIHGTLGATIALMLWIYFSSLAILIGAEVNAQIHLQDVTESGFNESVRERK